MRNITHYVVKELIAEHRFLDVLSITFSKIISYYSNSSNELTTLTIITEKQKTIKIIVKDNNKYLNTKTLKLIYYFGDSINFRTACLTTKKIKYTFKGYQINLILFDNSVNEYKPPKKDKEIISYIEKHCDSRQISTFNKQYSSIDEIYNQFIVNNDWYPINFFGKKRLIL